MTPGRKYDYGKLRWGLLPNAAVREVLKVLMRGAEKYDVGNWKHVPDAKRRYYEATMRHMTAWWDSGGQEPDPEWGLSHLAHAGCCLLFLLWFEATGTPFPPPGEEVRTRCPRCASAVTTGGHCGSCGWPGNPLETRPVDFTPPPDFVRPEELDEVRGEPDEARAEIERLRGWFEAMIANTPAVVAGAIRGGGQGVIAMGDMVVKACNQALDGEPAPEPKGLG
jgi:hypothetical protein